MKSLPHPVTQQRNVTRRACLPVDISEILPYLNATLRGAVYLPEAHALTWKKGGHSIVFHACEVATSNVEDRNDAERELRGLVDLVNRTWERRAEIMPDHKTHQRPTPMAIYKLLPNTNCKKCGEPTCYTFALRLSASQKKLADCSLLFESQYAEKLAALDELVIDAPQLTIDGMKKALLIVFEDKDILELMRILIDDDTESALAFLKKHFKGKARDLLEGG